MKLWNLRAAHVALLLAISAARAAAQCPEWATGFEPTDLAGGNPIAVASYDDGVASSLWVGGTFTSAGPVAAANIARWDGSAWHAVPGTTNGAVRALIVFDDGQGPKLYAAGAFTQIGGVLANRIASWDGTSWSALGSGLLNPAAFGTPGATCLHVHDDGSGAALYVGGNFAIAGGLNAVGVARWDGAIWSSLQGGVVYVPASPGARVKAFATYDFGSGPRLVVGGSFSAAGAVLTTNVASWDGSAWSALAPGLTSYEVDALAVYDEGAGPRLFVGGRIANINGVLANRIARYDGSNWSSLPGLYSTVTSGVSALFVQDAGSGPELWAADPVLLGPPSYASAARWNGSSWTPVVDLSVGLVARAVHDEGQGPKLFVIGSTFGLEGGVLRRDPGGWSPLHAGSALGGKVLASAVIDEAGGSALYVARVPTIGVGTQLHTVSRWDGSSWSDETGPLLSVRTLQTIDDGSGTKLYAGTNHVDAAAPCLWRRDGSTWIPIGGSFAGSGDVAVMSMAHFDDGSGPALYVGGRFASIDGVPAARIAKWDGSTWSALGTGVSDTVLALKVWDDGSGPALYAAGMFEHAGGAQIVNLVAKWNGSTWSPLASGLNPGGARVNALEVWNDGNGPALYAGGTFLQASGVPARRIARWNGTSWTALGSGFGFPAEVAATVYALHAHDDGNGAGSGLYVGGSYSLTLPHELRALSRWSGSNWSVLDGGPNLNGPGSVQTLATFADGVGDGPALHAGGSFTQLGGVPARNFARRSGCGSIGSVTCANEGFGSACPCGNPSPAGEGRGCTHSQGLGARLRVEGVPSVVDDSLVLSGDDMTPNSACLYFQGTQLANGVDGNAFGDGVRCAGGAVIRIAITMNAFGASSVPVAGGPELSSFGITPASSRVYQAWYRDAASYCTPSTFNLTNGVRVVWTE